VTPSNYLYAKSLAKELATDENTRC
jgi:hypothetical protein